MKMITLMVFSLGAIDISLDAVEYFAGEQAVTYHKCIQRTILGKHRWLLVLEIYAPPLALPCLETPSMSAGFIVSRNTFFADGFTAKVTSAWAANRYRAAPFEIKLAPQMDILSTQGLLGRAFGWVWLGPPISGWAFRGPKLLRFCLALLMALMLKDNGFAMIATVCSSWVFVNRATPLWLHLVFNWTQNRKV